MAEHNRAHLRTPEELSPEERAQLESALDSGMAELPPNQLKGFLGERGPDMRKVDDFAPDLNAGILQENDAGVVWLAILIAYLLFFPIAYVALWRSKSISRTTKWIASALGAAGIALVALLLLREAL